MTSHYISHCRNAAHRQVVRITIDAWFAGKTPSKCDLGHSYIWAEITGRLASKPCDNSCASAKSSICICSCRGMNHGANHHLVT